ncbi:MAG TPA: RIP metalloprotease RseP [Stellaceae bacterium]|nr:RIP metalloprotease RseP [Stellaceae bacterium]
MGFLTGGLGYLVPFLVVLTILVFVHELGHYLVARWNKVRVEVFSIGFGPELFGWTDRAGTRWKVSALPLGGYVKMFGEGELGTAEGGVPAEMSAADRAVSFKHKRLPQRASVVVAGPAANFIFAIAAFAIVFATVGQSVTQPVVGQVIAGSAAEKAGLKTGDKFVAVDGTEIARFEQIQQIIGLNTGTTIPIVVDRDGKDVTLMATPVIVTDTDRFGNQHKIARLGVSAKAGTLVRLDPGTAILHGAQQTWGITAGTLEALWQMVSGRRSGEELSGPVGIVRMSGEVATGGVVALIGFMAVLSVNLGLINLFPIPVLDGGHLLFYVAEAIRGKPLGNRAQEYGIRLGLALVLTLMVFATWNDFARLHIVAFIKGLVT